jgi:hypothetical protein
VLYPVIFSSIFCCCDNFEWVNLNCLPDAFDFVK